MKFKLHLPTLLLLRGLKGIELGPAAHNSFGVEVLTVAPQEDEDFFAQAQRAMGEEPTPIDLYGHAASIPVPDATQDFVLSSHVIEHAPDIWAAFVEWQRVLKIGGYVVMITPLPTALPADIGRPLTTLEHIREDYQTQQNQTSHPEAPNGGHWHIFSCASMKSFISEAQNEGLIDWEFIAEEDPDTKVGNGFWLAYQKRGAL